MGNRKDKRARSSSGGKQNGEFEVELVCNKFLKREGDQATVWYEIKWLGYTETDNTAEPYYNLGGCQDLIDKFEKKHNLIRRLTEEAYEEYVPDTNGIFIVNPRDACLVHYQLRNPLTRRTQIRPVFPLKKTTRMLSDVTCFDVEGEDVPLTNDKKQGLVRVSDTVAIYECCDLDLMPDVDDDDTQHEFFWEFTSKPSKRKSEAAPSATVTDSLWFKLQDKEIPHFEAWKNLLKNCKKPWPLIENIIDDAAPPSHFQWVEQNVYGAGLSLTSFMTQFLAGCECLNCSESKCTCPTFVDATSWAYEADGRLKNLKHSTIVECNHKCLCSVDCPNRVVQRGRQVRLVIFRCSNGKGWGVKTLQPIRKGMLIDEYVGEIIGPKEATKRQEADIREGQTYLFDLDAFIDVSTQEPKYTMDANFFGNVTHFLNHSCSPNLRCIAVVIDTAPENFHRLAFFAIRDIEAGEELTFDYGGADHGQPMGLAARRAKKGQGGVADFFRCLCGESTCRGVIRFR